MCISDRYLSTGFPHSWQNIFPWLFHDHFLIFYDHLSYWFRFCSLLRKTSENANFLHRCLIFFVVAKNIQIWYNSGSKLVKFHDWYQNSMTFDQFVMFHDFSMTIFIFQVFQPPWEPWSNIKTDSYRLCGVQGWGWREGWRSESGHWWRRTRANRLRWPMTPGPGAPPAGGRHPRLPPPAGGPTAQSQSLKEHSHNFILVLFYFYFYFF